MSKSEQSVTLASHYEKQGHHCCKNVIMGGGAISLNKSLILEAILSPLVAFSLDGGQ